MNFVISLHNSLVVMSEWLETKEPSITAVGRLDYGTEGVLRFGAAEPLLLHRRGEDIVLPRPAGGGKTPLHNFIDAIRGEAEVQAPPICGLRVAQLTEAAYTSAQSGKPEQVG